MPHKRSDEQLMLAYVAGDAVAFEELFRRYHDLVRGHMRRGYLREADVEDLTQQVFLQLHRARRDYRAHKPLRPWLMTIARNVKRDHFRRQQRWPGLTALPDQDLSQADSGVDRVALREALDKALGLLPGSLRSIVQAYWVEHLSHAEIARRFGISRAAARVRIHRAYRALRLRLTEYGYPAAPET
jgi:RNA polymerase sigma-70 factor (ECF subfamily)